MNSFASKSTLSSGNRSLYHLPLAGARGEGLQPPASSVQPEDSARKPAPPRGRGECDGRRYRVPGQLGRQGRAQPRNRLHAGAGADAGFHRRAGDCRPGRDARRHQDAGRRSGTRQSAGSGGTGDRSLGAGGRVRDAPGVRGELAARIPAQPRALCVSEVGADGVSQLLRSAAGHGDLPPGES